jgi:hypothetical protein
MDVMITSKHTQGSYKKLVLEKSKTSYDFVGLPWKNFSWDVI